MAITLVNHIDDHSPYVLVRSTQFKSINEIVMVQNPEVEATTEEEEEQETKDFVERIREAVQKAEEREAELIEAELLFKQFKLDKGK